jgi:excisionase family DNA binding protein
MVEEWITTKEAAEILDITPQHMAYLLRKRIVKGRKIGRDWLTTHSAVQEYLEHRPKPGPQSTQKDNSAEA